MKCEIMPMKMRSESATTTVLDDVAFLSRELHR